jgi:hypothetical protein
MDCVIGMVHSSPLSDHSVQGSTSANPAEPGHPASQYKRSNGADLVLEVSTRSPVARIWKAADVGCRQEFTADSLFSSLTVAGLGQISAGPEVIFTFSDGGTFGPSMRSNPWRQLSSRILRAMFTI